MFSFSQNSTEKMQACIAFAELFFVLYSTTDRTSFEEASLLTRYISRDKSLGSSTIIMLVGTKSDLEHTREVEEHEGRLLASDLNCGFYQISNSEGYVETQELLFEALRLCLEKNKPSPFSRVKEGLVETAKSLRKRSVSNDGPPPTTDQETPKSSRPRSFGVDGPGSNVTKPLSQKSSSQEDLNQERKNYRNSVTSTASF